MSSMVFFLFLLIAMVSFLLYQVARHNTSIVTTICIVVTLSLATASSFLVYNSLGYARQINLFNEKWILHYYVPDDATQTFTLMVQSPGDKPKLVSYKITNKEKYEKQKKGLTKAQNAVKEGQLMEGSYDSESEEFRFYEFSMRATRPKE